MLQLWDGWQRILNRLVEDGKLEASGGQFKIKRTDGPEEAAAPKTEAAPKAEADMTTRRSISSNG